MEAASSDKKIVLTQNEVDHIRNKVEDLRASLYKTDFHLKAFIDEHFTEEQKFFMFRELKGDSDTKELEKSIDNLLANLSNIEAMLIKLPFEPTASFTRWIKEFFTEKMQNNENIVIKFETDPSLIAGALMEFKGKIRNGSKRDEILNILSS